MPFWHVQCACVLYYDVPGTVGYKAYVIHNPWREREAKRALWLHINSLSWLHWDATLLPIHPPLSQHFTKISISFVINELFHFYTCIVQMLVAISHIYNLNGSIQSIPNINTFIICWNTQYRYPFMLCSHSQQQNRS